MGSHNAKCCSSRCSDISRAALKNQGVQNYDYIECAVCKQRVKQISFKHAKMHGFKSPIDMRDTLNCKIISESKRLKHVGENNPGYHHDGKLSKWSKNFKNGYDADAHAKFNKNQSIIRNDDKNKHKWKTNIEYWLKETNGNEDLAQELYKKFQTRNLSYFIAKYGQEEGVKRHQQKILKWTKSFKKQNFSNISQELFREIDKRLDNQFKHDMYYATYDREDMISYKNKEYRLSLSDRVILPDFILLSRRKIIEFDGSYWHSKKNKRANPTREKERDLLITSNGYLVLHILETDYMVNKEKVLEECINFLTK